MDTIRAIGWNVLSVISGYSTRVTYRVVTGKLYVTVPGGVLQEQRELIRKHKHELVAYLTTPPEQTGMCRRGHMIEWQCNQYGIWVCKCYFEAPPIVSPPEGEQKQEVTPISPPAKGEPLSGQLALSY